MDEAGPQLEKPLHRLYKSSSERIVDGVCGGIARYLEVDASVIRLLLLAFAILSVSAGVIFYIVAMAVMPTEPTSATPRTTPLPPAERRVSTASATATLLIGIMVVIVGVTLIFDYYNIFAVTSMWHSLGRLAMPIILILMGGALLLGRDRSEIKSTVEIPESDPANVGSPDPNPDISHELESSKLMERRKLTRSVSDSRIAGVCGGLAEYLNIDPTVVRIICVLLAFASFGLSLILYVLCAFIIAKGTRE